MAILGKYFKTPSERKRYMIDYADWLDTNETVVSMVFVVDPSGELDIDAYSIASDGLSIVFFANAGDDQADYVLNAKATTSGGQVKEDEILFEIREL